MELEYPAISCVYVEEHSAIILFKKSQIKPHAFSTICIHSLCPRLLWWIELLVAGCAYFTTQIALTRTGERHEMMRGYNPA